MCSAPDGVLVYAIGDIHGRSDLLQRIHEAIDRDIAIEARKPAGRTSVFEIYLGDYIDRGDDARGTIELLTQRATRPNVVFLRGNHEQYLLDFLDNSEDYRVWDAAGAATTLQSYGVPFKTLLSSQREVLRQDFASRLPRAHLEFFQATKLHVAIGDYVFVHAGIRPGVPLSAQKDADLLQIREPFLSSSKNFGFIVVHGHTPVPEPEFKHNRINIDTGAFACGRLTCLKIASSVELLALPEAALHRA